jgi:hypothetical protein
MVRAKPARVAAGQHVSDQPDEGVDSNSVGYRIAGHSRRESMQAARVEVRNEC